jgi:hypothetical protein
VRSNKCHTFGAYLDSLVEQQASMRDAVRQATINAATLTRGRVWEIAMRILRAAAERGFTSESDRMVYMSWAADKISAWMAESSASEN